MPTMTSYSSEVSGLEFPALQAVSSAVERATVDRARAGDQQALADIYDWYMPRVYRYTVARVGNSHEAEDLTEEVFLKLLGAIGDFRWRDVPFSSWVFRIAHNCVATHYRRSAQRGGPTAEIPLELADGRHNVAQTIEEQITMEEVRAAAARLPEAQREVIAMRFAVGLSIAETAKALGKREGNVKALQHKAVAKLQKMLIPEKDGPAPKGPTLKG
jgi:RNA polymerase sigma-70 factor (ECF subfamily)